VVHLWVEGAWEVIAGALLAFMLMKVVGARREVVEKWMYVEVGFVMFTGILAPATTTTGSAPRATGSGWAGSSAPLSRCRCC